VAITINGNTDVTALILPPTYSGNEDTNNRDNDLAGSTATTVQNVNDGPGSTTIHGSNFGDTINAGNGSDNVYGHGGDDTIRGEGGADSSLFGQAGNDTIAGGQGGDTIYGGSGNDTIFGYEAPAGNTTSDQGDKIYGGSGNDTIYGQEGSDTIIGGYGEDQLTGGQGADIFQFLSLLDTNDRITDFGTGGDTLDFAGLDANATAAGDQSFAWGGTTATANGLWYQYDATANVTRIYADTDGNLGAAEFMVSLDGNVDLNAAQANIIL
jgi:Ca2+-binding RTX toxin-like protein